MHVYYILHAHVDEYYLIWLWMVMHVSYISQAAATVSKEDASERKHNDESSSSFIKITSSLSQSVSSNMHRGMQQAMRLIPSLPPGKEEEMNPYIKNLLNELNAALVSGPLAFSEVMT